MHQRPGIMLYFELRPTLDKLSYQEKGILLEAILEYGEKGIYPDLPDRLLLVWPFIQIRLDADARQYDKVVTKRRYAAYTRWAKRNDHTVMSFEDWIVHHGHTLTEREEDELDFQLTQIYANA